MEELLGTLEEFIKEIVIEWTKGNLKDMFKSVNSSMEELGTKLVLRPSEWNTGIYSFIRKIADNVMMPIAGIILTYVFVYEIVSLVCEKNNLQEGQLHMFFKYILKMCIAVFLISHTFEITMAVFDVGGYVVEKAVGVIDVYVEVDIDKALQTIADNQLKNMEIGEMLSVAAMTLFVKAAMYVISIVIQILVICRMFEIYLYISCAPIPFATLTNKEWGTIGTNYIKVLLALAFQGFFMMMCAGMYGVLVRDLVLSTNLEEAMTTAVGYAVVLCFMLLKTYQISKSVFGAH